MPLSVLDKIVAIRATSTRKRPEIKAATSFMAARSTPKRSSKDKYNESARTSRRTMYQAASRANRLERLPATRGMSTSAPEIRGMDVEEVNLQFDQVSANNFVLMNPVQSGGDFYKRDGAKITLKNLHIRGYIRPRATHPSGGGGGSTYISAPGCLRMLVVYDRQPTGALPSTTDLLRSHDQAGVAGTTFISEINLNERARFTILRDRMWAVSPFTFNVDDKNYVDYTGAWYTGGDTLGWQINEFIKLKDLQTIFKGTDNPLTIAHISTGAIYMLLLRSGNDVHLQANIGWRLRYGDP